MTINASTNEASNVCNFALSFFITFFSLSTVALAQDIEEVIVEAERQVGLDTLEISNSVKEFSEEDLEVFQIASFDDIENFVPGLTVLRGGGQQAKFTIRGIGVRDTQLGIEGRVGLYIDGAFLGRSPGSFDLVDLANVQVLKGPVGSSGGRNAVAGSINFTTNRVKFGETTQKLKLGVGNYDARNATTIINLSNTETFGVRLGLAKSVREGWVNNEGVGEDFWGYDRESYRISLGWAPIDSLRMDYSYDGSDAENQPVYFQPISDTEGGRLGPYTRPILSRPNAVLNVPVSDRRVDSIFATRNVENSSSETFGHTLNVKWDWSPLHSTELIATYRGGEVLDFSYFYPATNELELATAAILLPFPNSISTVNFQIPSPPAPNLSALPEWQRFCCTSFFGDPDNTLSLTTLFSSPPGGNLALDDHRQFSIEIKQTGSFFDEQLSYVAGLYYFNEDTGNGQQLPNVPYGADDFFLTQFDKSLWYADVTELLSLIEGSQEAFDRGLSGISSVSINRIKTKAPAAYMEWTYNPTIFDSRLHLTVGARYTKDEKALERQPLRAITLDILENLKTEESGTWENVDPNARIRWDVSESAHVYFSYAEAFRAGNFNVLSRRVTDTRFEAEFISSFEVGYKGQLFDDLLKVEFALFKNDLEDGQQTVVNQKSPLARSVINVDSVSEGMEINVELALSEEWSLKAEYSYLTMSSDRFLNPFIETAAQIVERSQRGGADVSLDLPLDPNDTSGIYDEFIRQCTLDFQDDPIENTTRDINLETGECTERFSNIGAPVNQALLSLNYRKPTDWGEFSANLSYSHWDETFVGSAVKTTPRDIWNLRTSVFYELPSMDVKLSLWSQNLFDHEYTTGVVDFSLLATDLAFYGAPRTFGLDVELNWE